MMKNTVNNKMPLLKQGNNMMADYCTMAKCSWLGHEYVHIISDFDEGFLVCGEYFSFWSFVVYPSRKQLFKFKELQGVGVSDSLSKEM